MAPPRLDPVIHQPNRLQILTFMFRNREVLSRELREALGLTAGNLASHIAKLEQAGYVQSGAALIGLSFHVRHRITDQGSEAFRAYLDALRAFLDEASRGSVAAPGHASAPGESEPGASPPWR